MSMLRVENLHKTFGEKILFDGLSFTIEVKERIGLIGVNGTGKSTLLKVLAGLEGAEEVKLFHANDFTVTYLPQQPDLTEDRTILEQIYHGESIIMKTMRAYEQALIDLERQPENEQVQNRFMTVQQQMDQESAWEANTTAKTILSKLGIQDVSQQIRALSGGQKKRVAIAEALIRPADLLLLDEPTNHLDHETVEWLEGYLANYKGALIVITHDRYFLNRVTNQMYELDQGKLYQYEGNFETYLQKRAEREELEQQTESKRQNLLKRELEWLRRGAKARTTKQKARVQRAEGLRDEAGLTQKQNLDFSIGSQRLGNDVLELNDVAKSYKGHSLFEHVNYLVVPHQRLGIIGSNGTGKTTLLNILAGRITPDAGEVSRGSTVKIGYYTQDDQEIDGDLKVIEYIKEIAEVVYTADGQTVTAEQMLERFLFPRSMQWTYIRRLSGGEKRRLYLLKVLMGEPNVLFLDEPTNDLDIQTLAVLEDYIDQFPGVVITVSHDRYFLDKVVDHLLYLSGSGDAQRFQGDYSEFLEQKQLQEANQQTVQSENTKGKIKTQQVRKLTYKEKQEWESIEEKMEQLEQQATDVAQAIDQAGSDYTQIEKLLAEKQRLEKALEETMDRWTELSEIVEATKA
ncbi:ABC-F family ATP-binding cassette domain-containing protein [Alkalicoccobacillus plakortidis]|uniref:ABC-F family ATP-binding cassette domain-containing protein n=1 Tax=Alkalicoccobacillus plakortidis TaxID=444060 RepID=A0ABT0XLV5_9BACI|nr:ABC-F family ATP-binding cassette domain-containing protein [Alkalicoccobacillus plakortidis]MCM2676807.1 ABC-F family ATP-binding cassette domain-containing protein [Alkalicoccobacillus plakortidis]